jgi:chromosome condensin MukBEF ATPase and DNA-binding subunit MukB
LILLVKTTYENWKNYMNKKVLRMVFFILFAVGFVKASDRQTIFVVSTTPNQSTQLLGDVPSYEKFRQSNRVILNLFQIEKMKQKNKNLEIELMPLRREVSQFKSGKAVLQDFNRNDNTFFSWHDLPTINDLPMVKDRNVAHDEIENLGEQAKALQVEQDIMNSELQALKNWKYQFDLGRKAFYLELIEQAMSKRHER